MLGCNRAQSAGLMHGSATTRAGTLAPVSQGVNTTQAIADFHSVQMGKNRTNREPWSRTVFQVGSLSPMVRKPSLDTGRASFFVRYKAGWIIDRLPAPETVRTGGTAPAAVAFGSIGSDIMRRGMRAARRVIANIDRHPSRVRITQGSSMFGLFQRQPEHPRIAQVRLLNLFATLSQRELRVIDGLLHDRRYLQDEIVFDAGEEGQALYVVLTGRILICRQGEPEAGRIAEIPAGALFGELALLEGAPRVAQARALEDSVLAALSRSDFTRLMETHGAIASKIALQLARDLGHKLVAGNRTGATRLL